MKLIYQLKKYLWFILILSVGLGQQKLELENNNDGTWNVLYSSPAEIAGFQFDVDGATVISASGGSAETAGLPDRLITGLKKMSKENLSNLTPHWLNVMLNYSHPPVLERIKALSIYKHK